MRIDEREIERFGAQLKEKNIIGPFHGPGGHNIADFKSCLLKYLQDHERLYPQVNPFPVRLNNYIEGSAQTIAHTIFQLNIDYDQIGGIHLKSMSAYRQTTIDGHIYHANEDLKGLSFVPERDEVMNLNYKKYENPITHDHIEDFVARMDEKGFDGMFYGQSSLNMPLTDVINELVNINGPKNQYTQGFMTWIGTVTYGKLGEMEHNSCRMKIKFNHLEGIGVDHVKYAKHVQAGNRTTLEREQRITSLNQMPSKKEINERLEECFKNVKRKRLGI